MKISLFLIPRMRNRMGITTMIMLRAISGLTRISFKKTTRQTAHTMK
jgi:hypothetical protein